MKPISDLEFLRTYLHGVKTRAIHHNNVAEIVPLIGGNVLVCADVGSHR